MYIYTLYDLTRKMEDKKCIAIQRKKKTGKRIRKKTMKKKSGESSGKR
jgi:DNA-binding PadR family transcriptional regulator